MRYKQSAKKKLMSIAFILVGIICLLFSLLSSMMGFAGIGLLFLIIGVTIYMKSNNKNQSDKTTLRIGAVILLLGSVTFYTGCTVNVPMTPIVGKIEIQEKLPVEAGLLISEETGNYIFRGNPESYTASARPHEFPLGKALENASMQTFTQVFKDVTLVRTSDDANKYKIFIEPIIEDFHFRYDQLTYAGFKVAVISKIKVHVTLASGETKVWEKSIESPEITKGPWFINTDVEKDVGESASEALVFTLKQFAFEIANDISIRQFIEKE